MIALGLGGAEGVALNNVGWQASHHGAVGVVGTSLLSFNGDAHFQGLSG